MQPSRPADGFEPFRPPELRIKKGGASQEALDPVSFPKSADSAKREPTLEVPTSVNPPSEPNIQVIREDGLIRQIKVECSCGETIELNCVYDAPPTDSPRLHRGETDADASGNAAGATSDSAKARAPKGAAHPGGAPSAPPDDHGDNTETPK